MKRKYKAFGALLMSFAMAVTVLPATDGKADESEDYVFDDSYSLGWNNGISVYKDGSFSQLSDTDVPIYSKEGDNPFCSEIEQAWDAKKLTLTRPVQFTTSDGEIHNVESMLTNFDFIADPTAIDNSSVDGKLYVYGTTEGFTYANKDNYVHEDVVYNKGDMVTNRYANHSVTILSTSDMVNWTDEGFMDTQNLTNLPSDSTEKVKAKYNNGGATWAPSGLKIDGDGDGDEEYYLFYTNGANTGYVMGDSPTGPWSDPLGGPLCHAGLPNCNDCKNCFDPAVLVDDQNNAYVYFGGLSRTSGRAVQIAFENGTGKVHTVNNPVKLETHAMFEDNEINQFNGKYYYSYCSDFHDQPLTKQGSICVYVSSDPLNIAFDPTARGEGNEFEAFEEDGVYHHFLGTVLDNPSVIYGQSYNNHHHMQSFKDRNYIFYHSTVLNNSLHRASRNYRCLHVDEIQIDEETDEITIEPTYEGAEQIDSFNPYKDYHGYSKYINATTSSYSAGVSSVLSDELTNRVNDGDDTSGGSPMALNNIDTGDWVKIQGVDTGNGPIKLEAVLASTTDNGAIEVFVDTPTKTSNKIATLKVKNTGDIEAYEPVSTEIKTDVYGVHDLYFVFRGSDYRVASWKFEENPVAPVTPTPVPTATPTVAPPSATATAAPTPTTTPTPAVNGTDALTPSVDTTKTYKVGSNTYKITDADSATVNYVSPSKKSVKAVTIPGAVKIEGVTYKVTGIAANAFKGCSKLTKVSVGKNVKVIGAKAFKGCNKLKTIDIKSTVLNKVGTKAFAGISAKATIKVPKKKLVAYKKVLKGKGQGKKVRIK